MIVMGLLAFHHSNFPSEYSDAIFVLRMTPMARAMIKMRVKRMVIRIQMTRAEIKKEMIREVIKTQAIKKVIKKRMRRMVQKPVIRVVKRKAMTRVEVGLQKAETKEEAMSRSIQIC